MKEVLDHYLRWVQPCDMTTPVSTMSAAQEIFYGYVAGAVPTVNPTPPGVVQGGIDYDALLTALADFGLVTADAVNVFAEDFQAIILEALTAGLLASSIVANIEDAIQTPTDAGPFVVAAKVEGTAAPAVTVTASSLLAQLLQQDAANLTLVQSVFTGSSQLRV
jgi:hypothetical protein